MSVESLTYRNIFLPGDTWANYVNLDSLQSNVNFASWTADLYHDNYGGLGELAYPNVFTLTKDIITGSSYRFYFDSQTISTDIENGCYRLLVNDPVGATVIFVSEIIEVVSDATDTLLVRYRNTTNIQNYNYEGLPTFKNIQRLPLIKQKPSSTTNKIGISKVSGRFKGVRTQQGKTWEFLTGWLDGDAVEAWVSAINHSTFEVFVDGQWVQFNTGEDSEVTQEFQEDYPLIETTVRLEETAKASSNKLV